MIITGAEDQYCATGFPMGCYVDEKGQQKDACVISRDYSKADHYYIFNHVDITITYHSGKSEDWGKYFQADETGGRIVSVKLVPRSIGKKISGNYILFCFDDIDFSGRFAPKRLGVKRIIQLFKIIGF